MVVLFVAVALTVALQACGGSDPVASIEPLDGSSTTVADQPEATDTTDETDTTETATTTDETDPSADPVSFDGDFGASIVPILETKCAVCHNSGGPGSPNWQLETAADAAANADFIGDRVGRGEMPPWPAGPLSVPFHDDRSLTEAQTAAVLGWVESGGELDVDPATPIVAPGGIARLDEIDAALTAPEPYDGSPDNIDDYRCFVFDPELDEDTWLTGYAFVPDQTAVVHHAIGYRLTGERAAAAVAADAAEPGPGWQCYGSSGLGRDELLIGWAPGQEATNFDSGAGLMLEAGDFFVVQIHYHYDVDAPADASRLELDLTDGSESLDPILIGQYVAPAEIPCRADETGPLCDRDAAMANAVERFGRAGVQANTINLVCRVTPDDFAHMTDGTASSSCDLPAYTHGEVLAVLGHEHEIGESFRMTLNPGRDDELILLDIPDWDFDWQYNYRPVDSIIIEPGDVLRIECSWDRARRRSDLEPAYIFWADGTNDEMCFSTVAVRG